MTEEAKKWYSMSDIDRLKCHRRRSRKAMILHEKALKSAAIAFARSQEEVEGMDCEIRRLEREANSQDG
jgi:hypothetical protein